VGVSSSSASAAIRDLVVTFSSGFGMATSMVLWFTMLLMRCSPAGVRTEESNKSAVQSKYQHRNWQNKGAES
jgi:hypothetical protein